MTITIKAGIKTRVSVSEPVLVKKQSDHIEVLIGDKKDSIDFNLDNEFYIAKNSSFWVESKYDTSLQIIKGSAI